jgi:hypothetical protein
MEIARAQVYAHQVIEKHIRHELLQLDCDAIREIIDAALLPIKRKLDANSRLVSRYHPFLSNGR